MATTTATITLSSADLTSDALALSSTATLTKGGNSTGLDQTYGLQRRTYASTSAAVLFDETNFPDATDPAFKVYIKNTSTIATEKVTIKVGDSTGSPQVIGDLFAGDWMFIPYSAMDNQDITVTPNVSTALTLEYMVIYHS